MYDISELRRIRPETRVCPARPRLFFALYYKVADRAFEYAARTWLADIKRQEASASHDQELFIGMDTESDFWLAWQMVNDHATRGGLDVTAGSVFSHASKQAAGNDGLEFKSSDSHDGTLKPDEIRSLPVLPWASDGYLVLTGCNTGNGGDRSWTPAEVFCRSQHVITVGQTGYAYFSKTWSSYTEKLASDSNISLWAYKRGKNGMLGNGNRMDAAVFSP
jgi:hypothetical protein